MHSCVYRGTGTVDRAILPERKEAHRGSCITGAAKHSASDSSLGQIGHLQARSLGQLWQAQTLQLGADSRDAQCRLTDKMSLTRT